MDCAPPEESNTPFHGESQRHKSMKRGEKERETRRCEVCASDVTFWVLHSNPGHAFSMQPLLSTSARNYLWYVIQIFIRRKYLFTLLSSDLEWAISLTADCLFPITTFFNWFNPVSQLLFLCYFLRGAGCYSDAVRNCCNAPSLCRVTDGCIPHTVPKNFLTQRKTILHETWGWKHQHALEYTRN